MADLTSRLTIKLTDDLSAPAGKAAEALKKFGLSAADVEKASKLVTFREVQANFRKAATTFRETQTSVKKLAQEFAQADKPTRQMGRALEQARKQASEAASAFKQQSGAFRQARTGLDGLGISLAKIASEEERVQSAVRRATAAMEQQAQRAPSVGRRLARGLGHAGGAIAPFLGPGILHGTKEATKAGAEIQSAVVKLTTSGVPKEDIDRAVGRSVQLQSKYTNVKRSDILETYKDLRSVLLHPEEAFTLLEPTIKARSAMNAQDRSGHQAEGLTFGIKAAEILGLAQDPKRYTNYLDSFIRAQQVLGKTISPEQQYELAKYFRASAPTLSDRFKTTTAISLAQELGGTSAGQGVDMFVKQIVGGFQGQQHAAAKEFVALGLAKKDDFETTKTGSIKGLKHGRHVKGADLAASDPDQYVYKYILPALKDHGFVTLDQQINEVRRLFPGKAAADTVAKLIQQQASYENHAKLYANALGLNATGENQKDPFVALNSLTTSLTNFGGTLTSPAMATAASVLSSIASGIGSLSESLAAFQKNNPTAAKWLGAGAIAGGAATGATLTYQLLQGITGGFGLRTASTELLAASVNLNAAAGKVGAGSAASAAAGGMFSGLALPAAIAASIGVPAWVGYNAYNRNKALPKGWKPTDVAGMDGDMAWAAANGASSGRDFTLGSNRSFGRGVDGSFQSSRQSPFPGGTSSGPSFDFTELRVQAADSGQQIGAAVRAGMAPELAGAVDDARKAAQSILHALTFSASPDITPRSVPTTREHLTHTGSLDSNLHSAYADFGFSALG